jgi:large subunit ribosomal protein L15
MELNNLKPAKGSTHRERRIGRGEGSGKGGTSTRGHKGAQSRSGYSRKLGFEGGQMPLQRRLPKFGFTNIERVEFKPINLSTLEELAAARNLTEISVETLIEAGFLSKNDRVKILGNGTLTRTLTVTAHAFSKSAQAAIESLQGKAIKAGTPA